jgi:hypothetical protein
MATPSQAAGSQASRELSHLPHQLAQLRPAFQGLASELPMAMIAPIALTVWVSAARGSLRWTSGRLAQV